MTMTNKLIKEREIGKAADLLLQNVLLKAVLDSMREEAIEQWTQTQGGREADVQTREHFWLRVKCVDEFRHRLAMLISAGEIADRQLSQPN